MRMLLMEMRKEKRNGVGAVLTSVGILGALYAFANFAVRGETLLNMPLKPMDVLLTQLYGMLMVLNMFGIIVAACMIYSMEFQGNAVKKMYLLPVNVSVMYLDKFLLLTAELFLAVCIQNLALACIGIRELPAGEFVWEVLLKFAGYSFLTSMPVLAFMLLVSSRSSNMWVSLGIGVAGFLSGMALAASESSLLLVSPFVVMLKPAVAMSAVPDGRVLWIAATETILFTGIGLGMTKYLRFE